MRETNAMEASLNAKIFNLFALNKAAQVLTSVLDPRSLTGMAVDVATEMGRAKTGALYVAGGPGDQTGDGRDPGGCQPEPAPTPGPDWPDPGREHRQRPGRHG